MLNHVMSDSNQFKSLNLSSEILANLDSLKYLEMTPIQQKSLPVILDNKDLIAQAKTGSGKTAAFGLGLLSKLDVTKYHIQSLVLCPTRELAEQVCTEIRKLARFTGHIKVLSVTGGTPEFFQARSLYHGAHIIVGTPGRVQKFLEKGILNVANVKMFVLDEADRMLDMGFFDDIHNIASFLPKGRQTLLFSATYPPKIEELSNELQKNPVEVTVDTQHDENAIKQIFFEVESQNQKMEALTLLLGNYKPESVIIFCNTKVECANVEKSLQDRGISALAIHGDLEQKDRTLVFTKFSNRSCSILVATDVAARGLDVKDVQAVINYDIFPDPEVYVHRIGRTGRAGKEGLALNLFTKKEKYILDDIENYLDIKHQFQDLDSLDVNSKYDLIPTMSTLFISGGKKDNIRPGDILGALTKDAGILAKDVGDIKIFDINSYVEISFGQAEVAATKLNAGKIKGKKFRVGLV
jgi:ATP-independent RNA helicase DbpA